MKFENCAVYNFDNALQGMRNPKNSWDLSDSYFGLTYADDDWETEIAENWIKSEGIKWDDENYQDKFDDYVDWLLDNGVLRCNGDVYDTAYIGPKDMRLAKSLVLAGPEHRKFLRQIFVSMDITAPFYWWKEMDTYKVGTVADSCSTMHKLTNSPITLDSFEIGDFYSIPYPKDKQEEGIKSYCDDDFIEMCLIPYLEYLRQQFLETKDEKYWKELVRWLPESWLQKRTWTANYEILRSIYRQRKNHKLTEWHQFCKFLETLPYAEEFIIN